MTFCYYVDNISSAQSVEDKKPETVSELKGDGYIILFNDIYNRCIK